MKKRGGMVLFAEYLHHTLRFKFQQDYLQSAVILWLKSIRLRVSIYRFVRREIRSKHNPAF